MDDTIVLKSIEIDKGDSVEDGKVPDKDGIKLEHIKNMDVQLNKFYIK